MFDQSLGIDLIQDRISVILLTGSKHYDLVVFAHLLQKTQRVGTDRNVTPLTITYLDYYLAVGSLFHVTVNQCLVHINHQHLF